MSAPTEQAGTAPGGIALCEDAWRLLRVEAATVLPVYYVGTLPFAFALSWLWFIAIGDPLALRQLPVVALIAALAYIWMKTWQARYAQLLLARLQDTDPPAYGLRTFMRSAAAQSGVHATAWLVMPVALLLTAPLAWVYGFYQTATVIDTGSQASAWRLGQEALAQAQRWQKQNHVLFWLYSPFLLQVCGLIMMVYFPLLEAYTPIPVQLMGYLFGGIILIATIPLSPLAVLLFVNISAAIGFFFGFLKTFFAIDTVFTNAPGTLQNTPAFFVAIVLATLCLDPLLKAAYTLRSFHSNAQQSGEDLRIRLRAIRATLSALVLFCALSVAAPVGAAEGGGGIDTQRLGSAIEETLDARKYNWRVPPDRVKDEDLPLIAALNEVLVDIRSRLSDTAERIGEWLRDLFGGDEEPTADPTNAGGFAAFTGFLRFLLLGLCAGLLLMLLVLLYRSWRTRREAILLDAADGTATVSLDIEDDATLADQLPEEGWIEMAQDLQARGEYRLAIRALFLATLARLSHLGFIRIARFKSNRDYARELARRAHIAPELLDTFAESAHVYDAIWYGTHHADEASVQRLFDNRERLRGHA